MSDCCSTTAELTADPRQRRVLIVVLALNLAMFFIEFTAGWLADSSGLIADSLDMLADAAVYAISLYAVGRSLKHKAAAALANGGLELLLGLAVMADILRRTVSGSDPAAVMMIAVAALALVVNVACLVLLHGYRKGDINLKASWICTRNDVMANIGVIVAAVLVAALETPWPDWLIGALIAIVIVRSAWRILRQAWPQWREGHGLSADG